MKILHQLPENIFTEDCHFSGVHRREVSNITNSTMSIEKFVEDHAIGYCIKKKCLAPCIMFEYDGLLFWHFMYPEEWGLTLEDN